MDLCVRRTPASDWEPRSPDVQAPGPSRDHTTAAQPPALNHRTRGRGWGPRRRGPALPTRRPQALAGPTGRRRAHGSASTADRKGSRPSWRRPRISAKSRADAPRSPVPAAHTPARPEPTREFGIIPSASPRGLAGGGRSGGLPGAPTQPRRRDPNRGDPRPLRRWTARALSASCCGSECLGQGDRTQSPAPIEPNLYPRQPGSGARGWRADTGRGDGSGSEG